MDNIAFIVEGMSCSHCENRIKKALNAIDGVKSVEINIEGKKVDINYDSTKTTIDKMKNTIEETGYNVL